jgi:hypothetical protein
MKIKETHIYYSIRAFYLRHILKVIRVFFHDFHIKGTYNSDDALHCYAVYMRHLVTLWEHGMRVMPCRCAEIGPGSSLGVGLCALLAGTNEYYAFDVLAHTDKKSNLKMLDELLKLFKNKTPIPTPKESGIHIKLQNYDFPSYILPDSLLKETLNNERILAIKNALIDASFEQTRYNNVDITIKYIIQNQISQDILKMDWIFSQAVMMYVDNLSEEYSIIASWLADNGFMSHDIDFRSMNLTWAWNGHWAIKERKWLKIAKNVGGVQVPGRAPLSKHICCIEQAGFKIVYMDKYTGLDENRPSIRRNQLKDKFKTLSDDDFNTSRAYIIAQKR